MYSRFGWVGIFFPPNESDVLAVPFCVCVSTPYNHYEQYLVCSECITINDIVFVADLITTVNNIDFVVALRTVIKDTAFVWDLITTINNIAFVVNLVTTMNNTSFGAPRNRELRTQKLRSPLLLRTHGSNGLPLKPSSCLNSPSMVHSPLFFLALM